MHIFYIFWRGIENFLSFPGTKIICTILMFICVLLSVFRMLSRFTDRKDI